MGERVAIKLIDGSERDGLLESHGLEKAVGVEPRKFVTLACNRRLMPASKVQIVYGKGVSTPSGVADSIEKRFNFTVREPFAASFSCERENAQSACLPIRPTEPEFQCASTTEISQSICLISAKESLKPTFES